MLQMNAKIDVFNRMHNDVDELHAGDLEIKQRESFTSDH
jgi:hypothetical protein